MAPPRVTYTAFVGIDIAAASFTVAASAGPLARQPATWEQTPAGFATLQHALSALAESPATLLVVLEATGSYWLPVALHLQQAGYAVSVVNPATAHHFAQARLRQAKTDALDAQGLVELGRALQPACWTPPPAIYHELEQRLSSRQSRLELRGVVRNQLHALRAGGVVIASVAAQLVELEALLVRQIAGLDAELASAAQAEPGWATNLALLQTIPGVGLLTAAWLVVATVNFSGGQRAEQVAAYAGLAPQPRQAGSSVRGRSRIGARGHRQLRSALYMATLSAGRYNPAIKTFYERLRAAGKPPKVARCAAARKLVHLAVAIVARQQPFKADYGKVAKLEPQGA